MYLAFTPEQEQLRQELRGYFASLMTPEVRRALADDGGDYGDGQAYREIVAADRPGRLADAGLAQGVRRPRRAPCSTS